MRRITAKPEVNVLFLFREGETYVFSYTDEQTKEIRNWAGRHAADPELNFTWNDAGHFAHRVREIDWKSNAKPNL
jgi:hypothetical protein